MNLRSILDRVLPGSRMRNVLQNFSWITLDRILRMVAGLLVGVWVARYLGPKQYGEFNYLVTYVSLFATVASFGLDSIVVRELSRNDANKAEIIGTTFAIRLGGSVLGVVLGLLVFVAFHQAEEFGSIPMLLVLSMSLLFVSFDVLDFWFQSRLLMRYSVLGRNIGFIVGIVSRIVAVLCGLSLFWFAVIYTAEAAFGACGLLLIYSLSGEHIRRWKFSAQRCMALINQAKYLFITSLLIIAQARIDQIMLANFLGAEQLGLYVAALRMIESFTFLPMMIQTVLVPVLSRDEFQDPGKHEEKLLNVYRLMVLIFLPIGIPLVLFSTQLVNLLFGPQYQTAAPLLALMSIRLLLANFGVAKSLFFLRENAFGISLLGALTGCVVNIGLNFILIREWGTFGVVWASTFSFFVTIFIMDLFFRRTRRNFFIMVLALITPWRFKLG